MPSPFSRKRSLPSSSCLPCSLPRSHEESFRPLSALHIPSSQLLSNHSHLSSITCSYISHRSQNKHSSSITKLPPLSQPLILTRQTQTGGPYERDPTGLACAWQITKLMQSVGFVDVSLPPISIPILTKLTPPPPLTDHNNHAHHAPTLVAHPTPTHPHHRPNRLPRPRRLPHPRRPRPTTTRHSQGTERVGLFPARGRGIRRCV